MYIDYLSLKDTELQLYLQEIMLVAISDCNFGEYPKLMNLELVR